MAPTAATDASVKLTELVVWPRRSAPVVCDNMRNVDCSSLRRRSQFLVVAKCLVFGAFAIVFGLRLGPIVAAILLAAALVVTTGLVLVLRFRAGRWSQLSRGDSFCAMATIDPGGPRPSVGQLTADAFGITWAPTRRSRPGSVVHTFGADSIASIAYGPWSRIWQDSVLIIRPVESESVGMRVFSRPIDLGARLSRGGYPVTSC